MQGRLHQQHRYDLLLSADQKADLLSRMRDWEIRVDEPVEIDPATYDRAIERFVSATVDHPDVVAVYGDSVTPTVPGLSDIDLALVVEDQVDQLADLQARVDAVMAEFSFLFSHGVILIPKSVFERLSLLANNTMSFDHLGGASVSPMEPDDVALTLRFFDWLAAQPQGRITQELYPKLDSTVNPGFPQSVALEAKRAIQPLVGPVFGWDNGSSEVLHLDKRRILSTVGGIAHDRELFTRAIGSPPDINDGFLDRVEASRHSYFDDPPTTEECLEYLLDGLTYRYHLTREFIAHQTIYPDIDQTFHLRRSAPTVATPVWPEFTPYWLLTLCYDSRIRGRVLPPSAALHLGTLPNSDRLFYGTAPKPIFTDDAVVQVIEQRNEALRQYFEFVEAHDGWERTFKLIPAAAFVETATELPPASSRAIGLLKEQVRATRNRVVTRRWDRTTVKRRRTSERRRVLRQSRAE